MTEYIIYEHDDASGTLEFPTKNPSFSIMFEGKEVVWRPDGEGIAIDPNQVSRSFSCTADLTSTELDSLKGWVMPASAPTYGVYPRMKFYLDSTTYWDDPNWIKCMIVGVVKGTIRADAKWAVTVIFAERT